MTKHVRELPLGCKVSVFPGLRKHNTHIKIGPLEICEVVELPLGERPADAMAIRRPSGEVLLIDADLVVRVR